MRTKNKEQTKEYLEIVHTQFTEHNIYNRCMKLKESAPTMTVQAIKQAANQIDNQITIAALHAEKNVTEKLWLWVVY